MTWLEEHLEKRWLELQAQAREEAGGIIAANPNHTILRLAIPDMVEQFCCLPPPSTAGTVVERQTMLASMVEHFFVIAATEH